MTLLFINDLILTCRMPFKEVTSSLNFWQKKETLKSSINLNLHFNAFSCHALKIASGNLGESNTPCQVSETCIPKSRFGVKDFLFRKNCSSY